MFVMLMLFVFSGLIDFPLSIVALTVMGALPYWRARCLPPRGPGEVA
jgi:hypothetical protein